MKLRNTFAMALGAGVVAIGMASTASAQVYSEDFNSAPDLATAGFTTEDTSGTGTWYIYNNSSMDIDYDEFAAHDDWSITPGFNLTNGEMYNISFDYYLDGFSAGESLDVYFGQGSTGAALGVETQLLSLTGAVGVGGTFDMDVTAGATGLHYLGFHAYSPMDESYISIDNIVVTQLGAAPAAPGLLAPADAAVDQNSGVQLIWSAAAGADDYDVWVTTNAGDLATTPPVIAATASGLTATRFNAEGLSDGTTYYWMVGSNNGFGSDFSAVRSFTTRAAATMAGDTIWSDNFENVAGVPVPGYESFDFDSGVPTAGNAAFELFNLANAGANTSSPPIAFLSVYNADASQNDDWLLLPEVTTHGSLFTVVDFRAMSISGSFLETFEVYKGTGMPPGGYTLLDTIVDVPTVATAPQFSYDLDMSSTQRLAIRHISADEFALLVDDVEIRLQAFSADVSDWTVLD